MVIFMCILVVARLAVSVYAQSSYSSLSPPAVTITLCVLALFGLRLATNRMYEIFHFFGTAVCLMKKIVLVPFSV